MKTAQFTFVVFLASDFQFLETMTNVYRVFCIACAALMVVMFTHVDKAALSALEFFFSLPALDSFLNNMYFCSGKDAEFR